MEAKIVVRFRGGPDQFPCYVPRAKQHIVKRNIGARLVILLLVSKLKIQEVPLDHFLGLRIVVLVFGLLCPGFLGHNTLETFRVIEL